MDGPDEIDRLLAELKKRCDAADRQRALDMLEQMHRTTPVNVGDRDCILLGFESNVDAVWAVPDPRPDVLKRPIPVSHRKWLSEMDAPPSPSFNCAEYRRIGEFTYQRFR